jgi:hypothetical protein
MFSAALAAGFYFLGVMQHHFVGFRPSLFAKRGEQGKFATRQRETGNANLPIGGVLR